MIYLVGFLVTFLATVLCSRRFGSLEQRTLIELQGRSSVIHTRRISPMLLFLLCSTPLFLISAFRYDVGTDYFFTYTPRFLEIIDGERTYYEIGFYWFNRLIALFTHDPQWVFITTSFVFILFVFLAFYQNVDDLSYCVIILLVTGEYFISLNNLRQAMASAVLLFGYRFIRRKQWLRFGLLALICATLHKSMLIFIVLLAVFILMEYVSLDRLLVLFSLAALAVYAVLNLSPVLLEYVLPERLVYYIRYSIYNESTIGLIRTAANMAIFAFLYFTRFKSGNKQLDVFVMIQFFAVVTCLFDSTIPAAYRILRLFSFWQLLSLPMTVKCYDRRENGIIVRILIALFMGALCFYSIVILGDEAVLPYRSIFGI